MYTLILDEKYEAAARGLIESATADIRMSTFKIQRPTRRRAPGLIAALDLICDKSRAGVRVQFLMNWDLKFRGVAKTNAIVANAFRAAGIDVRYLPDGRCSHAKILIVDGRQMLIGSHNWSAQSFTRNFELSVLTDDDILIRQATEIYGAVFTRGKKWL
jgi:phosphatidylserine/phosphatidylglycerophosphate/cardiolipin synthase-like enzyme